MEISGERGLGIRDNSKLRDPGPASRVSGIFNNPHDHENNDKNNYYYDGYL